MLFFKGFPKEELSSPAVSPCYGSPRVRTLDVKRGGRSRFSPQLVKQMSGMHSTHELELFPDHTVTQMLFKEVTNAAELRQSAMAGKIKGALINPTMVRLLYKMGSNKYKEKLWDFIRH